MKKKIEIVICLGSSCFARGNRTTVDIVKGYIKKHHLESMVDLKGGHCFGKCEHGPHMKIDGVLYGNLHQEDPLEILAAVFEKE